MTTALLGASACADSGPWSPSDPKEFDRTMVNEESLAGLSADDQAYVMGHSIGVYLMGKTLPARVADHGYLYRPGWSSPRAKVDYDWELVLRARSGGNDGSGGMLYDDVGAPLPFLSDSYERDPGDPSHGTPGAPSDDVEIDDDPDNENGGDDPDDPDGNNDPNNPDDPGDGGDDHDECGVIERKCTAFLNPAAFDAQGLAVDVDPAKFAPAGLSSVALDRFIDVFGDGLAEALSVEEIDDFVANSEVVATEENVLALGYCEY